MWLCMMCTEGEKERCKAQLPWKAALKCTAGLGLSCIFTLHFNDESPILSAMYCQAVACTIHATYVALRFTSTRVFRLPFQAWCTTASQALPGANVEPVMPGTFFITLANQNQQLVSLLWLLACNCITNNCHAGTSLMCMCTRKKGILPTGMGLS